MHPDCYSIRVDDDIDVICTTYGALEDILQYAPDDQIVLWGFAEPFVNPVGA
jgi:hypothetical protein